MRRIYLVLLFIFLILFFFISSRAIVNVKIQELRFQLTKEQLLNYELSSKVLKEKIKQMRLSKDDFTNEIKVNILESNVMNAQLGLTSTKLSPVEKFGLSIVNFVRLVSGKSRLTLEEDQNDMMKIQFTFFLERTRKFSQAVSKYDELENSLGNKDGSEMGFIMLHNGFSTAMSGDTELAISKLKKTEEKFAGTYFADNARILIKVLLEGNSKNLDIEKKYTTNEDKAVAYYETGQYKETLAALDKIENRNDDQNYLHARSLEELGQSNVAVKEYLALVESGKVNTEVAKKANRRLLMIGSIYEKNKDLTDYSKSNAEKLGDTEVVKAVEDGSKLILDSVIVEKLLKGEVKDAPPEMAKEFEELKKELQTIKAVEKEERKEVTEQIETKVADIRKKEIEVPEPTNLSFLILLTDGRELKGKVLEFEDEKIHILSGVFSSDLPFTVIKDIKIYESATFNEPPIKVISKKNKVYQCFKITKIDDTFTLKLLKDETKLDIDEIKKITIR